LTVIPRTAVSIVLLFAACSRPAQNDRPHADAVAVINADPIPLADFQFALDELRRAGKGYFANKEEADRVKRDLLERMIDDRLLLQEARRRKIVPDPKLAEASIRSLQQGYPEGTFEKELESSGRTLERFRRDTDATLIIFQLLKQEVIDRIAISRDDIEKYFQEHRDQFVRPEEVRVRQIVTRTREEAEQLRKQIQNGDSFEDLARKNSIAPEATQGGDLGYFPRGRMPAAIESAAFELWPGTRSSKVIESPYGFHLFQLVDRRPPRALSVEEARVEIERALLDQRGQESERFFIRSLREQAAIERNLKLIDRIH